jgi:preprotein translocase subunit YajC
MHILAQEMPQGGQFTQTIIMIGVALVFFYFLLWRPEQKRRKAAESMRSSLKKGDRVTAMAIVGVIEKVNEGSIIIKTADNTRLEMLKIAITDVVPGSEA